jgi:hypothetical protein
MKVIEALSSMCYGSFREVYGSPKTQNPASFGDTGFD